MLLLFFSSCAYYNTFYNAETSFKTARKAHQKFLLTTTDSTARLPGDVISGYERAIEKSQKVLEVYPKDVQWHDDAVYLMARASYYKGDYSAAVRRFRKLQMEFPESEHIPHSHLYLGKTYMADGSLHKAEKAFRLVLERYPALNRNEEVTLLLAELAIRREGKAQAVELLEKTLESVQADDKRMEIIIKISSLYIDLELYEKAISVLEKAPRKKEYHRFLYQIDYNLLVCYMETDRLDEALSLADEMLRKSAYVAYSDDVLLRKGIVLRRTGRIDESIEALESITSGTGDNAIKGEAWFHLGEIYQFDKDNYEKARECYAEAEKLARDEEIRALASQRADALVWLKNYGRDTLSRVLSQTEQTDSTDTLPSPAVARYKIGEVYWLHLDEPDSALSHFRRIAEDSSASGEVSGKALFAAAWITRHLKKDTAGSDSLFGLIQERFPGTIYAKRSQVERDEPVTVLTRQDSAWLAFTTAERLYFEDKNATKAVNAYYSVGRHFADIPEVASKSLYAAAWLCDHVLRKDVTARKLYRTLCDSFPESDYCIQEAQPRLRFVEDTLRALSENKASGSSTGAPKPGSNGPGKVEEQDDAILRDEESEREPADVR
jgi:tetratricopeptide (TPR) repeat protein